MAVSKAKPAVKKAPTSPQDSTEKKPVKKVAASKTVTAKPAPPKAPIKPKTSKVPAVKKTAVGKGKAHITPEQRYRMICDAAYFHAERRGFVGGNPCDDWTLAEAEVDEVLRSMHT
jgi:hypothetical protein